MAKKLTDIKVGNTKPDPERRREIPDAGKPGLYLVVQSSGRKSWAVRYRRRSDGKPRKYTLDGFPALAAARKLAQAVLDRIADGADPAADKIVQKQRKQFGDPSDIEALFIEFMRRHTRKRNGQPIRWSTRCETARLLGLKPDPEKEGAWVRTGNGVLKRWRGRTVESISKGDVLSLLDDLAESAPINANRALAALKTFFGWCIKRDKIAQSPCAGVDDPSPEIPRTRYLDDTELAALWRAAEGEGYPYGRLVQLLALTGCRRDEVREAPWSEFRLKDSTWLIPGERVKNGHDHLVTLPDTAVTILRQMPRITGKPNLLFTTTGDTPISGLTRYKQRLDAAMLAELQKANPKAELPPWRLHDLRHTLKTWMQKSRVPKDVRNAVQNHYDGGMDEHYGHHSFEPEKRKALQKWADHIASLIKAGRSKNNERRRA